MYKMWQQSIKSILLIVDNLDDKALGANGNYKYLSIQKKKFDCLKLFKHDVHDEPAPSFQKVPFHNIPKSLLHDFTYGNEILLTRYYFNQDFPRLISTKKEEILFFSPCHFFT